MRRVLPVLMKHHYIRHGKAVSLKIFGAVDVEAGINIFKGSTRRKLCGIDKVIVRCFHGKPRRLQAVIRLKMVVLHTRPVL